MKMFMVGAVMLIVGIIIGSLLESPYYAVTKEGGYAPNGMKTGDSVVIFNRWTGEVKR